MFYSRVFICILPFLKEIPTTPFVGVGCISEILSYNNVENIVFDMNLGYSKTKLFQKIEEFKPNLIGFFMMTRLYKRNYRIINRVKEKYKIPCIVGGPHFSTFRKQIFEECDADFGVKLEGELTLIELINGKSLQEILGLIYRENGKIHENPDRPFIKDLDKLPFPKYENFELKKYRDRAISIITSRGCPYQCIYCPVKTSIGQQFRVRSANNIFNEILFWYNKGYRKFNIQDDNFTLDKKRVIDLCRLIINIKLQGIVLSCPNGIRADRIDKETLISMKKAGFMSIAFGVEGGNNKILKILKKGETIEEIEEKINLACKMGFDVILFFLLGVPGETEEDVEDAFQLALKYPIVDAFFYNIVPYPQTELYSWLEKENLLISPLEVYLNTASPFADLPYFKSKSLPFQKKLELLTKSKMISKEIRKTGIVRRCRERYGFIGLIIGKILSLDFIVTFILQKKYFLRLYTKYLSFVSFK